MIPSLGLLTSVLAGLVAKISIAQLQKHGYMPQSIYVNRALKALENDDLDEAIRNYHLAIGKRKPTNRTEITHEIITNAIDIRITKLQTKIDENDQILHPPVLSMQYWRNLLPSHRPHLEGLRDEQLGCEKAITVLNSIKNQLAK